MPFGDKASRDPVISLRDRIERASDLMIPCKTLPVNVRGWLNCADDHGTDSIGFTWDLRDTFVSTRNLVLCIQE